MSHPIEKNSDVNRNQSTVVMKTIEAIKHDYENKAPQLDQPKQRVRLTLAPLTNLRNISKARRTEILSRLWPHCQRPSKEVREYLASELGARACQIGRFFENQRYNERRRELDDEDYVPQRKRCKCGFAIDTSAPLKETLAELHKFDDFHLKGGCRTRSIRTLPFAVRQLWTDRDDARSFIRSSETGQFSEAAAMVTHQIAHPIEETADGTAGNLPNVPNGLLGRHSTECKLHYENPELAGLPPSVEDGRNGGIKTLIVTEKSGDNSGEGAKPRNLLEHRDAFGPFSLSRPRIPIKYLPAYMCRVGVPNKTSLFRLKRSKRMYRPY